MNLRQLFLHHVAQTSPAPLALDITGAEGCWLFDRQGKKYLDLIGGISVANTGHRHPQVVEAVKQQIDTYMHVMVYGEFIQSPQVSYAKLITEHLPSTLNSVYFTNSGAEAVEGAMKLAKRITGRTGIAAFENSYHGSTQGALSVIGSEYWRNAYRPLLPGISHLRYNNFDDLEQITSDTACVIAETIQAEAGIKSPSKEWMKSLAEKCSQEGALLVLDEIQAGFGRTGRLWGFEHFEIVPDIMLLGKALGGGMPMGAFIADRNLMAALTENPVLGHITTFGGHPVCAAAGKAAMEVILSEQLSEKAGEKGKLFEELLIHSKIKNVSRCGLWLAVDFGEHETCKNVIDQCISKGVVTDWFLFAPECLRISPPLTINEEEIILASNTILASL